MCVQVIRRLRERGEPVRLFGETDYDAFQRLRKIEILAPEVNKARHHVLTLSAPHRHSVGPDSVCVVTEWLCLGLEERSEGCYG